MSADIQAVVLGATGYVGGEFLRLLAAHPDFTLAAAVSESRAGDEIAATFPHGNERSRMRMSRSCNPARPRTPLRCECRSRSGSASPAGGR